MNEKWRQLNQKNTEREKQITEENEKHYTPIIIYLRGSYIPEYDQECVRQDLIDMTLSAQERGESLESLIGGDYKQFCDEVIAAFKPNRKEQLFSFFSILFHGFFFLGLIGIIVSPETVSLIEKIVNEKRFDFQSTISISLMMVVVSILIIISAFFLVYNITKNAFKNQYIVNIVNVSLIGVLVLVICIMYFFFGSVILFKINFVIAFFLVCVSYVLHKVLENYSPKA